MTSTENYPLTEKRFYLLISLLILTHFFFRGLFYSGAPTDDAEQMLFSQEFRWGYDVANPPLYTWLVIIVQNVIGINLASVATVKFVTYGLIFVFYYKCALRALHNKSIAVMASLSPLWFYYVGWDAALSYSHTILATFFIVLTLFALFNLRETGSFFNYFFLGLIIGLGLLSKYTFVIYVLSITIAGFLSPLLRARFCSPQIIASFLIAGLLFLPHGMWLFENNHLLISVAAQKFEISSSIDILTPRLHGLKSLIVSCISFLSPLWLILCVVFWKPIRQRLKLNQEKNDYINFLFIYFCAVAFLMLSLVILAGFSKFRVHYFFLLIPAPLAFFIWIKPKLFQGHYNSRYSYVLLLGIFLCGGGMVVKYFTEPIRCSLCQLLVPYSELGVALKKIGFEKGTIFAYYHPHDLAGNLRATFPDSRIISTKFPKLATVDYRGSGQCLIVWTPKPQGAMNGLGMAQMLELNFQGGLPVSQWSRDQDKVPEKFIQYRFDRSADKIGVIGYILLKNGSGACR